jgi:hypothetical protein
MLRARVLVLLAVGLSLAIVGCGAPTDDPRAIVDDFRQSLDAGRQKYKGKTVRLRVEKVTKVEESEGSAGIQGNTGNFMIMANVSEAAETTKALALKKGEPATLEGEVTTADPGDTPGRGIIYMKSAKVSP